MKSAMCPVCDQKCSTYFPFTSVRHSNTLLFVCKIHLTLT
uniref:Uncharacterized protein n=1 Tax=Anguilla anguilla TaxID=7936 RepID=A0A0E9PQA0_ANGAN